MHGFIVIDGVDITPYLEDKGFTWNRSDLDSEESKRLLSGDLQRHFIARKHFLNVKCRPLKTSEASIVLAAIEPPSLEVTYLDPRAGDYVSRRMYANNIPAQVMVIDPDTGEIYWEGIAFQLTEY